MSTDLSEADFSRLKVLAVDDEAVMRTMLDFALKSMGITNVTLASDGDHAAQLIELEYPPFDIVVSDWNMPKMNGIELLKRIELMLIKTRFIMLTGNGTAEAVREAIEAGADSYVVKPFTVDDLRKKVKLVLKKPLNN
jgi:two-component system, chemotaxis family, chemotaxis protein CheY